MATLHLDPGSLRVEFTTAEKVLGLLRNISVRRVDISDVSVHDDPFAAVRGLRAPGFAIPWRRKVGTWRGHGYQAAVSVVAGTPAVRVRLTGHRWDEVIISTPDAQALADDLLDALG